MFYNILKILHILSATLVLTGIMISWRTWLKNRADGNSTCLITRIQAQTWMLIIPFAIFQLASGFTMISLKHYAISESWITGSIYGFVIAMISWLGFLYFLTASNNHFKKIQTLLLISCITSLLFIIFLMVNK